ncbi:glycosyltransferase family 52 [Streptococcus hongkongensis]|nr:hypothetical protein NC01_08265 [Streptococcus uberis]
MKKIYICHTVYHLLISLLKLNTEERNILILAYTIPYVRHFEMKLKLLECVTDVIVINKDGHISNTFFSEGDDIYIFNDGTIIGNDLRVHKIFYHLLEDSQDYYSYNMQYFSVGKRERLLWFFNHNLSPFGKSKYAIDIEVNNVSKVLYRDARLSKTREVSRRELFNSISQRRKEEIFSLFPEITSLTIPENSVLILTQPLFLDHWTEVAQSEDEQLNFYQSLIANYPHSTVFLKPHPRDTIDYSVIKSIEILPSYIPMEVIELLIIGKFKVGITHSSTALNFLECVDYKIMVHKFKEKSWM